MEDRYKLWVYAKNDDGTWSIPDAVMLGIWKQMVEEGRAKIVFYPGGIENEYDWMAWVKSPTNHPVIVVDTQEKKLVFVAWINSIAERICFAHFCGLGERTYHPEVGKLVMKYWSSFLHAVDGEPLFRAIFGLIPATNKKAVKLAEGVGFHFLGEIPGICNLVYKNMRVGGMFGYFIPQKET